MEYLIFSDSHGSVQNIQSVLSRQPYLPNGAFFLGDGLRDLDVIRQRYERDLFFYCVSGNCDWYASATAPEEGMTALEGHRIFFTHGHRFSVKGGYASLLLHAASKGADIVLCGHTHTPHSAFFAAGTRIGEYELDHPMYLFNPGSIRYASDGCGGTYGTMLLCKGEVLFSHGTV